MKIKKIFFLSIAFFFLLIIKVNANETVNVDISQIATSFNNYQYVSSLKNLGINISATQSKDNSITLNYEDISLTYSYDSSSNIYYTSYPISNKIQYKNYNIVNAIFIDCISTLQGNPVGSQIAYALGDSFCYSMLEDNGIAKNYFYKNDTTVADFQINPTIKMGILSTSAPIDKNTFLLEYETFYPDENCIVKKQDLFFYKTFSSDGKMELYIGNPNELNEYSYESILTAISILFNDNKASYYINENYSDFSRGNAEFEGVSIITDSTLPISNVDTILLPSNMKYAKFTIDRDIVKSKLDTINLPQSAQVGDSINSNKNIIPITIFIIVIIISIIIISIVLIRKKHQKN